MKVKAADIARELQMSKATVSLALNGKPGVSEQTRQEILAYKAYLENKMAETASAIGKEKQVIKVIFMHRDLKVAYNSLWTEVLAVFDREIKKMNYSLGVTYVNVLTDSVEAVVNECNRSSVAGVILCATEMQKQDYGLLKNIQKPMIITDNDFEDNFHHRVCIDNISAVRLAVEYLLKRNCRNIVYLANETEIFNFLQRREGFRSVLAAHNLVYSPDMIVPTGSTVDDVCERMKRYLHENPLPDAFIMENYQVSIGVIKAMNSLGISIPEDVSLIGVDEVPDYATYDSKLTVIKIDHINRAHMATFLLQKEITENIPVKFKLMSDCRLIEGNSVK
nr:LacI family DNA-binding transcriptional regulator [uncultured Clostridium sp.]